MTTTDNYPVAYGLMLLRALQTKKLYLGTVPPEKLAERRRANRVARASRRRNRD